MCQSVMQSPRELLNGIDLLSGSRRLNKRARLWNSAELLVLVLVLSEAVLAIEKDGKSRDY